MRRPTLVTFEGDLENYDDDIVAELLGVEEDDVPLIRNYQYLGYDDIQYLNYRYPEYMGSFLTILRKVGKVAAKGIKAIAKRVRERRKQKQQSSQSTQAAAQAAQAEKQRQAQQRAIIAQQVKRQNQMKMILPIAAIIAVVLLTRE